MHKETKSKNGLKKNKSSYMFFCIEERDTIKKDRPELNNKELVTELARRWGVVKELEHERLKGFQELAKADKERYLKEKENLKQEPVNGSLTENEPETKPKKTKRTKKSDTTNKLDTTETSKSLSVRIEPKKTKINGYLNFCKKMRETVKKNNPDLILATSIQKELGRMWKELSDIEKENYKNE
jgi:hypothetical protein